MSDETRPTHGFPYGDIVVVKAGDQFFWYCGAPECRRNGEVHSTYADAHADLLQHAALHQNLGRVVVILPSTAAEVEEPKPEPDPRDCPCCADRGYLKDGICITCGWGDLDHWALAREHWRHQDMLAAARNLKDDPLPALARLGRALEMLLDEGTTDDQP